MSHFTGLLHTRPSAWSHECTLKARGDAEAAPATNGRSALASPMNLPALRRAAFTCASAVAAVLQTLRCTSAGFRLAAALRSATSPPAPAWNTQTHHCSGTHAWCRRHRAVLIMRSLTGGNAKQHCRPSQGAQSGSTCQECVTGKELTRLRQQAKGLLCTLRRGAWRLPAACARPHCCSRAAWSAP
jgi:hypothetical protein